MAIVFATFSLSAAAKGKAKATKPAAADVEDSNNNSNTDHRIETSKGRYISGGVVGTVVGLGIGHGIQQRYWRSNAWIFTLTESAALGYMAILSFFPCDGLTGSEYSSCMDNNDRKMLNAILVFEAFHIWEAIDIWTGAKVRETSQRSVMLTPTLIHKDTPGMALVMRY